MRLLAGGLIVVGYAVAVPVMFRLRTVFAERRGRWFALFEGAVIVVALGHLLAGRPIAAAINAGAAILLAGAWRANDRRSRRD